MQNKSIPPDLATAAAKPQGFLRAVLVAGLLLGSSQLRAAETVTPGVMKWEVYTDISGTSVANLTGNENFPDSPSQVRIIPAYEGPSGFGDNYGARISGFITPQETGDYVFFLATDDNGELYLSPDEDPANKRLIARETTWSNSREWTISGGSSDLTAKRSDQFADSEWETGNTITLTAGQRYYTELLYKEGGGGDLGAVTMIRAGSSEPANGSPPLSGNLIAALVDVEAGAPSVLEQPQSASVPAGGSATLTVSAIGAPPLAYQWQRAGVDIPGATNPTLTINNAGAENFGIYTVVVTNALGFVTSNQATLTVTGLPTILFVHSSGGPNDADRAMMNRLQSQGWQVIPMGASTSQTSDAEGKAVVIVSSTITSGEVGDKFRSVAVPVINWEQALQDNLLQTADNDSARGVAGSQTEVDILNADHPMAAGLAAGTLTIATSAQEMAWGVVGPGATIIASLVGDPTRAALYFYDTGAILIDGTTPAPARRVHLPLSDNTFLALNEAGLALFDAAVNYATGGLPTEPQREFSIGLNFGADEPEASNLGSLAATNVAGVDSVAQANWNNLTGPSGTNTMVVADANGTVQPTSVTVAWTSNGTWASTGRAGEENNAFPTNSADRALMTGYLDTGNATTSTVTVTSIPVQLTQAGYDLYVYASGGVAGRGGSYRLRDATTGIVLRDYVRALTGTNLTEWVEVPQNLGAPNPSGARQFGMGNYIVFRGLTAPAITLEGVTGPADSGLGVSTVPRAPINAIQLVAPTSGSLNQDVTQPGDPIVSLNDPSRSPENEQVANAIDNNTATKYLNFGTDTDQEPPFVGPVGFTVTPSAGASVVSGLALTSANDVPERDPASFRLEGSNDGTNFNLIAEGSIPAFTGRFVRQEIQFTNPPTAFQVTLSGGAERPQPVETAGSGTGTLTLNGNELTYNINFTGLSAAATAGHIHGPASVDESAVVLLPFANVSGTSGTLTGTLTLDATQLELLQAGRTYVNLHTPNHPGGEIRGQIVPASFTMYRLTFPTVANPETANSLQIAEVELLGRVMAIPPTESNIAITRSAAQITITYEGELNSATEVGGPYTPVAGATSPYTVPTDAPARFYIAR